MFLALFLSCAPPAVAWRAPAAEIVVLADAVDFGAVPVGHTATASLALRNDGDAALEVTVRADAPFGPAETRVTVGAGGDATVALWFQPADHAAALGSARIVLDDALVLVALTGAALDDGDGDGHAAEAAGGDDCNDADPAVHPDAEDACYDGLDADCGGGDDADCDADGWPVDADCDDTDPAIAPDAQESTDGADDDCDGLVDEDALAPGDVFVSELHPGGSPWVELCGDADRDVALDGFRLVTRAGAHTLGSATVAAGACVAVCASAQDGCPLTAPGLTLDPADELVHVDAGGLVIDAVAAAGWAYEAGATWSLDAGRGADDNNAAAAWCLTAGTAGLPNPACP